MNDNFTNDSEKEKYLFCDGSIYDITSYPKLYKILGTNKLPKLNDDRFLQGSILGGNYIAAGLPNIKGRIGSIAANNGYVYYGGAFYSYSHTGRNSGSGEDYPNYTYQFDASQSNTIYGRSDTVQPLALTVRYYIRAK